MTSPFLPRISIQGPDGSFSTSVPITLGMVLEDFLPAKDSLGAEAQALVLSLAARGYHLVVFTRRRAGLPTLEIWNNVKIYRLFGPKFLGIFPTNPSADSYRRLLMENSVDILHHHQITPATEPLLKVTRSMKIRNLLTVRQAPFSQAKTNERQKSLFTHRRLKLLSHFDDIMCATEDLAQNLGQSNLRTRVHLLQPQNPAANLDLLERIYVEEFISKVSPRVPRATFADTNYHLDRRTTCTLCQQGHFEEASEQAVVPGVQTASRPDSLFMVWRCGICRSIHSLPKVALERYRAEDPLAGRRLNRYNEAHFSNFLRFLTRQGIKPDARILFYGVNANLFQTVAQRRGYSHFDVFEGDLTPEILAGRARETRDAVIVVDYLEKSEEPRLVLELASHELRPGGILVVHTPDAERIPLNWKSRVRLRQPYNVHILSAFLLESLGRTNGFRLLRQFRRHCMDTLKPFINFKFLSDLRYLGEGTDEDAQEFQFSSLGRKWWRFPRLLLLGLFGGLFPETTNLIAIFIKQKRVPHAPEGSRTEEVAVLSLRTTCGACGEGSYKESAGQAKVPSNVWRWSNYFTTVWRCRRCRSLQSLEKVDLDPFYDDYPYGQRQLDGFTRAAFSTYLGRLERHGLSPAGAVLDYGCSQGLFLEYLKERNFSNLAGYEPYVPRFANPEVLKKQYDAVICQDVIEHVEDPLGLMQTFAGLVKPGGLLCIGTPRADGIDLNRIAPALHALHQPYHIHILSEQAMNRMAEKAGFALEKMFRRHSCDTPRPFVNWPFYRSYIEVLDNTLNAAFDPPWFEKVARSPRLLFWGFFGYFFPDGKDMIALYRKPNG